MSNEAKFPPFTLWNGVWADNQNRPALELPDAGKVRYSAPKVIKTEEDFLEAIKTDHTGAKLLRGYRKNNFFINSSVGLFDVDKDNPDPDKVAAVLTENGIPFVIAGSRHHQEEYLKKGELQPALNRLHVYAIFVQSASADKQQARLEHVAKLLVPVGGDGNVKDLSRFFYGVATPRIIKTGGGAPFDLDVNPGLLRETERVPATIDLPSKGTVKAPPAVSIDTLMGNPQDFAERYGSTPDGGTGMYELIRTLSARGHGQGWDDSKHEMEFTKMFNTAVAAGTQSDAQREARWKQYANALKGARAKWAPGTMSAASGAAGPAVQVYSDEELCKILDGEDYTEVLGRLQRQGDPMNLPIKLFDRDGEEDTLFLYPGTLGIIAAPSGHGKTSLAFNIALALARTGETVMYLTYEEPAVNLLPKLVSSCIGEATSRNSVRSVRGFLKDGDTSHFNNGVGDATLYKGIDEVTELMKSRRFRMSDNVNTYSQLKRLIELAPSRGITTVFIDYVQLVEDDEAGDSWRRMSRVMDAVRISTEGAGIKTILNAQFNRTVMAPTMMSMTALAEGSAIEKGASWVLGVWNCAKTPELPENSSNKSELNEAIREAYALGLAARDTLYLKILKGRDISEGHSKYTWDGNARRVDFGSGCDLIPDDAPGAGRKRAKKGKKADTGNKVDFV